MPWSAVVLARWLQAVSQCLPEDREEHVTETVIPAEERKGLERELEARIERATRLHLEGHVRYEQFAEEKQRAQAGLADLRPARANYPATSGGPNTSMTTFLLAVSAVESAGER